MLRSASYKGSWLAQNALTTPPYQATFDSVTSPLNKHGGSNGMVTNSSSNNTSLACARSSLRPELLVQDLLMGPPARERRVCRTARRHCVVNEYLQRAATNTSDIECAPIRGCSDGNIQVLPPTVASDAVTVSSDVFKRAQPPRSGVRGACGATTIRDLLEHIFQTHTPQLSLTAPCATITPGADNDNNTVETEYPAPTAPSRLPPAVAWRARQASCHTSPSARPFQWHRQAPRE